MSRLKLHFEKAGLLTTIQDGGRSGLQAFGVPSGGVLDKGSAAIANWLVGNSPGNPVLEITFSGPKIRFNGDGQVALAGADISATVNDELVPMYETLDIRSGSILSFGRLKSGCRCYLAISGKWLFPAILKSQSAFFTGTAGVGVFKKEDEIQIKQAASIDKRIYPPSQRPVFPVLVHIKVLPGPEYGLFSDKAIAAFVNQSFVISPDSNRMGYVLQNQIPDISRTSGIISSGILPGTIQVLPSGQPVILLADAQTTGGYYRIANVFSPHLDILAQLKPGDRIRFSFMSPKNVL